MNTKPMVAGPLGFPQTDRQARAVNRILEELPRDSCFAYRKMVVPHGVSELLPGERADVSWISTEDPDRHGEVVLAAGMDDTAYKLNPIVTMNHAYALPPVGRSLWRRLVHDGPRPGIKAKTLYAPRPDGWPSGADWPPDLAFALVQAELLRGKSIGFLPTRVHVPDRAECQRHGWPADSTRLVIDAWVLLEYACTFLPVQPHAIVEAVSKSGLRVPAAMQKALGLTGAAACPPPAGPPAPIRFTPLVEIERHLGRRLAELDFVKLAEQAASDAIERLRGRI